MALVATDDGAGREIYSVLFTHLSAALKSDVEYLNRFFKTASLPLYQKISAHIYSSYISEMRRADPTFDTNYRFQLINFDHLNRIKYNGRILRKYEMPENWSALAFQLFPYKTYHQPFISLIEIESIKEGSIFARVKTSSVAVSFFVAGALMSSGVQKSQIGQATSELIADSIDIVTESIGNAILFTIRELGGAGHEAPDGTIYITALPREHYSEIGSWAPKYSYTNPPKKWNVGDSVDHKRFGFGIILFLDGDIASVSFQNLGTKSVNINFLRPAN